MTDMTTQAREAIIRCVLQSTGWSAASLADRILLLPEISVPLAEAGMTAANREQFSNDG